MLKIEVTHTTTDMVRVKIIFGEKYKTKGEIDRLLKYKYGIPKKSLMLIEVTTSSNDTALNALAERVDWGYLYDRCSESMGKFAGLQTTELQIMALWIYATGNKGVLDDAVALAKMGACTIYKSRQAIFQQWLSEYGVPIEAGELIHIDDVIYSYYQTMEILADGRAICLNW